MTPIDELLDKAKQAQGIETDMALAAALGVTRATVSGWRHGNRHPDPVACATLAGLTGEPLQKVLGIVGEARAISRAEKAVWRRLAATATMIALMLPLPARDALARPGAQEDQPRHEMHYANFRRLLRRLRTWLRTVRGSIGTERQDASTLLA